MSQIEPLIKGQQDWHLRINEVITQVNNSSASSTLQAVLESTGYGVLNGLDIQAQSTPDMTINITSGVVYLEDGSRIECSGNSALLISDADTTSPRIDIIYVDTDGTIGYLAGIPASSPIAPSLPTGAFLLSEINVGANVLSILNDNIVDKRKIKSTLDSVSAELSDMVYQVAGGTATVLTVPMQTLVNGYSKTFIASANNSGNATTINGKNLYKPGTTTAPNLIEGKAYTVWYNQAGNCFFIKASAEGDADVSNVLATKKFSNDNDTGLEGTMPNNGAVVITPSTTNQSISLGYHNGSGYVKGYADLLASNIVKDKIIGDVVGILDQSAVIPGTYSILYSDYTEYYTNPTNYTFFKGVICTNVHGTVTVKYDAHTGGGATIYVRIYVNGVARGIERILTNENYVTFSEDITVSKGDEIAIYAHRGSSVNYHAFITNFVVYCGTTFNTTMTKATS